MTVNNDIIQSDKENTSANTLNAEQLHAVNNTEGPLLVLAGAGTGKTKVLTSRIAHILSKGVFPSQILAVTFTNKAANEMNQRISKLTAGRSEGLWIGTFHSIAAKNLRRHAEIVNLKSNFTIIDTNDQLQLIKQVFFDHKIDTKRWDPKIFLHIINKYKDQGLTPCKVTTNNINDFAEGESLTLYKDYQSRLISLNAADFGDLLLHNLTIFNSNPEILSDYHRRFCYILVDEYQDTNVSQYLWLRLLAQKNKNICCVGDDDQSIYGWRGAEVGNILRFERDFPGADIIKLERNYRSTSHILTAASKLIANNTDRLGKFLWTEGNEGEEIKLYLCWDDKEEAKIVADEIESLQQIHNTKLTDIAILVRAGFQTRSFEECFLSRNIPYKVIGGLRFYERMEIRDIISYVRLAVQPEDSLALERIINIPRRGIGAATLQSIRNIAKENSLSMFESIRFMLTNNILKNKIAVTLENLTQDFSKWGKLSTQMSVAEFVETIINESGYLAMWKADNSLEAQSRIENIKELIRALDEFESIEEFLEHVSLIADIDASDHKNMVNIMTLHSAKGLEFNSVFLPGWEEGTFPNQRAINDNIKSGIEEERRLAYVGITRAKEKLYILSAANRRIYGQYQSSIPSRFIDELPKENVEKINLNNGFNFSSDYTNINKEQKPSTSNKLNNKTTEKFALGKRIFHIKFGYGSIIGKNGNQLEISFEKSGIKKVIDQYVEEA